MYTVGSVALVSLAIGLIYIQFLRSFDIYEKDPWFKIFISFLAGGVISVFFAGLLYQFFEVEHNMFDAIFKIGFTEEIAKLGAFLVIFWLFGREIDEPVDGVIYLSAVALGFACIESISYAMNSETPYFVLFLRAFISVVGHITFTGYMGIAVFIHKKVRKNYSGVLVSILLASLAHGLYDGLLFEPKLNFMFKYIFIIIILFHLYLIRIALTFSSFRKSFTPAMFEECDYSELSSCPACNHNRRNTRLRFWKIYPLKCSNCGNFLFTGHSFRLLMRYFRPAIRSGSYKRRLSKEQDEVGLSYMDKEKKLLYYPAYNIFSFEPDALTHWIRSKYLNDRQNALNRPVSGFIIRSLGMRFMEKEITESAENRILS